MVIQYMGPNIFSCMYFARVVIAIDVLIEQEIDGETMLNLTERKIEKIFPSMKLQVKCINSSLR